MNEMVKNSVESRRTALISSCNINDQDTLDKINDYFYRLEEFAKNYNDIMEFENAFASSELSSEYTNFFTSLMNNGEQEKNDNIIADEFKEDVKYHARKEIRHGVYETARDIPVIGEAMDLKNKFDLFNRFKKNKDK